MGLRDWVSSARLRTSYSRTPTYQILGQVLTRAPDTQSRRSLIRPILRGSRLSKVLAHWREGTSGAHVSTCPVTKKHVT